MVFVKVRETYDLHTTKNKMTVVAIHTPKPDIIKRNYPGLLMQCRSYRPHSCDVRLAAASMLPLDPLGVGTQDGDVAPEDVFNPILYKAMSNFGMSQLEARINGMNQAGPGGSADVVGDTATVDVDSFTNADDEFNIYYGLLANTHDWKHASPQAGLSMSGLRPLVYEMLYNIGDVAYYTSGSSIQGDDSMYFSFPGADSTKTLARVQSIRGNAKPLPLMNCLSYTGTGSGSNETAPGFGSNVNRIPWNASQDVPWINCVVAALIVPPSRLHELFFRLVVEWEIEFTSIRPLSELSTFSGVGNIGLTTHYQNYSYESTKEALTGSSETILDKDSCMVSSNADVTKVM